MAMIQSLLLQVRDRDDTMRRQEVDCFAEAIGCDRNRIDVHDLLAGVPSIALLQRYDLVLLGGSGVYSVAEGGPWLEAALDAMRELVVLAKPTFASCWGFQAMAKALGGEVVTDIDRSELGSVEVHLTAAGAKDPLFGPLGRRFIAPMGHQDRVARLPEVTTLLASSEKVDNQAFCLPGMPIYCTQFHPELTRDRLIERVRAYPQYARAAGMTVDQFVAGVEETPESDRLLRRFVELFV